MSRCRNCLLSSSAHFIHITMKYFVLNKLKLILLKNYQLFWQFDHTHWFNSNHTHWFNSNFFTTYMLQIFHTITFKKIELSRSPWIVDNWFASDVEISTCRGYLGETGVLNEKGQGGLDLFWLNYKIGQKAAQ